MAGMIITAVGMADVTLAQIFEFVIANGITPVLLILFVWYFINRDKTRDAQMNKLVEDNKRESAKREQESREREEALMNDCIRREELLKTEADKREKLLKAEAEKRESHLMMNMEKMTASMEKTVSTLQEMSNSISVVQEKLTRIENKMEWGGDNHEAN